MELVERYLQAVKFWLPKAEQDDILADLAEDIHSQMEDRETELGRALNEAEVAEILKQRGHPMIVAARFLPKQQLIGSAWFPIYRYVLKLVLLWIQTPLMFGVILPILLLTAEDRSTVFGKMWGIWWISLFTAFGVITLVFAALERYSGKFRAFEKWDPRRLPRVPADVGARRVSRSTAISEIITGIVYTAVLIYLTSFHSTFNLGVVRITLAPIWTSVFWPTLLISGSALPLGLMSLLRPSWTRARSIFRIALDVATLVLAEILLKADKWLDIAPRNSKVTGIEEAVKWVNISVVVTLTVIAICVSIDLYVEVFRIFSRRSRPKWAIGGLAAILVLFGGFPSASAQYGVATYRERCYKSINSSAWTAQSGIRRCACSRRNASRRSPIG